MAAFGMGSASAYGNNPMGGLSRIQKSVRYTPPVQMPQRYPAPTSPVQGTVGMDPGFGRSSPAGVPSMDRGFGRPVPGQAAFGASDPVGQLLAQLGIRTPAQRAMFSRWITAANQGR